MSLRSLLRVATEPVHELRYWVRLRAARAWRRRSSNTLFVGITGSHGKSTTTILLGEMLATLGPTYTGAFRNRPKWVAKYILRTRPRHHRYFVQEVAADRPYSVEQSVNALQPNVGIVTAIGGDHRKAFGGSWEATAAEKAKLVHGVPADGLAVLNADDPLVAAMAEGCRCRIATFGRAEGTDFHILNATSIWPDRLRFEVAYRDRNIVVNSRMVGTHWTLSLSAALLTALELGADLDDCLKIIESREPAFNRMSVHAAPHGAWYVLDAEKASFFGIEACIDFLEAACAPRKTAIFGMISDYPGASRSHYNKVARMALDKADRVVFTGKEAQRVRRLVGEYPDRLLVIDRPQDVVAMLAEDAIADEVIYVKASRATRLSRVFVSPSQR